uniref:IRF tryptophan pentad repeat domain-containing protein n=1 Tax=Terrapene triunguis TaxID=2587831 RepID=A0A674J3A6_9SAUR
GPRQQPGLGPGFHMVAIHMRLKEWLIAQIDSGRYPGLRWENREKTIFRIPWKHAAKQDYRQQQDAALFKAWAVYKGKYQEGTKADPSTWKTRLRCALNKSTDFQEVPERSQLDISEPYKVYQILLDGARDPGMASAGPREGGTNPARPLPARHTLFCGAARVGERRDLPRICGNMGHSEHCSAASQMAVPAGHTDSSVTRRPPTFIHCPWELPHFLTPLPSPAPPDCWLHVRLYYRDVLVKEFTTRTAEGCRITYRLVPADNERLYGPSSMEQIQFPSPRLLTGDSRMAGVTGVLERLLPHLDRGVLLWVAPEGVFMKRQCQGRVYWNGPMAPHNDQPNKLEREKTYKLLDTQQFLQRTCPFSVPRGSSRYQIRLCFGEEYPPTPSQNFQKLIMAHVEPVFARELFLHAQRMGPLSQRDSSQPYATDASSHITQILKQLCQP